MSDDGWWRRNVVEKVHAASRNWRTPKTPMGKAVLATCMLGAPMLAGMGMMSLVNEGGYFHSATDLNQHREELMEAHRKRIEEMRNRKGAAKFGEIASDARVMRPIGDDDEKH
mmetsp:Transcript_58107/g.118900  ORF Transcript_58107/g.118900 Transcript_58107/m.118900 type:complete len:113 (+) Transcript_58107:69-407(+)|eukprot:CAMPEP_0181331732 /NCGR_PEP_ID=MMETSP1101-20121128/24678_1 /TAXON_ID=46948 /ORGANISM="Rhodomonas abbreviata, Strain Caron Lab Isolate" /LENGTH=112 /DNA_ID=CAMNT_0023441251 /DNA_START=69 /DNA_END=407 /DNA_ORIENTATION=+